MDIVRSIVLFCIAIVPYNHVYSANILAISQVGSPSHNIWNLALLTELAERGHNITHVTMFEEKTKTPNLSTILMEDVYKQIYSDIDITDFYDMNDFSLMYALIDFMPFICGLELSTNGVKALLNYPPDYKFDLIFVDMFSYECVFPIIQRFGSPPTIGLSPYGLTPWLSQMSGDYEYPALVPYGGGLTNQMSFTERVWNYVFTNVVLIGRKYIYLPQVEKWSRGFFGENITSISETEKNISIFLVNNDPVLDFPRPVVPSVIQVGGLHIKRKGSIPNDVQKFLDDAKEGFILFSLGTNVRSDGLSNDILNAILDTFRTVPYKVLWKFESESLPGLPSNVMIKKWLPAQGDILGHSNIRLFISHGGALSTQEAIYHGVPMVCIPFFFDQIMNANKLMQRGYGVGIKNHYSITKDVFSKAVNEVLNNPKYKDNIMKASARYRDQPQTPMERALFWTEYVLRHGGAQHLHPPSVHMPDYQTHSLDVIAFLLTIVIVAVTVSIYLCRYLFCKKTSAKKLKIN